MCRYQVDISQLVAAKELKAVRGFDAIAQNHDLSNVLSLIDQPEHLLAHRCLEMTHENATENRQLQRLAAVAVTRRSCCCSMHP